MKGNKPDYNLSGLSKNSDVKGKVGVGWNRPDGSISIKLNPFVVLDGSNPDLVLTLFKAAEFETRRGPTSSYRPPEEPEPVEPNPGPAQDEIPF